ncbi:MAG: ABC transporter permease [Anaerolineales bacterium]|jgi:ABC-2 type transport system permease protein
MTAFLNHFLFEFKTGIRNKQMLFMNYLFPLGVYLLLGFIFPQINPPFVETLIPAMVMFAIVATTLLGMPDPLVSAREKGIFRSYKINGIPAASILAIPGLTTMLHLIVVGAIITFSAPLLFDAPLPVDWASYVLVFLVTSFACASLSLLIGVISPSTRMTILYSQLVFLPSMLLGGLMVPSSFMPETVARISLILPPTHAMNAFTVLAMGQEGIIDPWVGIIVLMLGGVIAAGLAVYLFNWDRHNATQRGHPLMALLALVPYVASIFLLG